MKNIKIVIAFILGILVSGFGVYALNISARDTAYDNTNSGSTATNMQEAIDDLYTKSGKGTVIDCGTYSNGYTGSKSVNITSYYSDYAKLTADNIYVIPLAFKSDVVDANLNLSISTQASLSFTYNAGSGVVNINGLAASTSKSGTWIGGCITSFKVIIVL